MKNKLISLFKMIGLFLLFFTISTIPILTFNIDITKFSNLETIIYTFSCNIIFLLIIMICYYKTLKKDFKPYFKDFWKNLEESFKYYIIGLGIMIISNILISLVIGRLAVCLFRLPRLIN